MPGIGVGRACGMRADDNPLILNLLIWGKQFASFGYSTQYTAACFAPHHRLGKHFIVWQ